MAASRRPVKELEEIHKCGMKNFRNIQVDEANSLTWQGLIVPVSIEHFASYQINLKVMCVLLGGSLFPRRLCSIGKHQMHRGGCHSRVIR